MKSTTLFVPVADAVSFNASFTKTFDNSSGNKKKKKAFRDSAKEDWNKESKWKIILFSIGLTFGFGCEADIKTQEVKWELNHRNINPPAELQAANYLGLTQRLWYEVSQSFR